MVTIIIIAVVVVIILAIIGMYNNLVKLRNNRENAFADIDVQLKQRFDLVPQLVATVKGYAEHEKGLLESITAARSAAMSATSIDEQARCCSSLLQLCHSRAQQRRADLPQQHPCWHVRFPQGGNVRDRGF